MQKNIPDYYNDLDKLYLKIWELLKKGLENKDAPFHRRAYFNLEKKQFEKKWLIS